MSIYILSHPKSKRIPTLLRTYGLELDGHSSFSLSFINAPPNTILNIPIARKYQYISTASDNIPNLFRRTQHASLIKSFVTAADHFLKSSNNEWFFRGIDDTFINVTNLESFVSELEQGPNPLEHPRVYGNCAAALCHCYLQGGAGFVFSRAAVEIFMRHKKKFFDCSIFDDYCISSMLPLLGLDTVQASSPYFSGHDFPSNEVPKNAKNLPSCLKEYKTRDCCAYHIFPVSKVAFFHSFGEIEELAEFFRKVWQLPLNIYMNNYPTYRKFCTFHPGDIIPNNPRIPTFYNKEQPITQIDEKDYQNDCPHDQKQAVKVDQL